MLVPVNGASSDEDAIDLACLIARRHRARVEAIFVIRVERSLPLDAEVQDQTARGEEILEAVERTASAQEVEVESSLLQARDIGAAIVDEAVQMDADLIIMGVPFRRRFGEYELGATATYVLKNAPCRVWVARQMAEA